MKQIVFLGLFISIFSTGCKQDDDRNAAENPQNPSVNYTNSFLSGTTVSADFTGRITDREGNPVANAFITIGNSFGSTNMHGLYKMSNVSVDASFASIQVIASNYFDQYRNLKPRTSHDNLVDIQMIPKSYDQFFEASAGGSIQIGNGGTVVFEPNSIVDAAGNTHSGLVVIASTYLDPTDPTLSAYMPGSLAAVDAGGNSVAMITYGMIGVEMVNSSGQPLQIGPDFTAQISFPIADAQMAHAPAELPLWYFHEGTGVWYEESSATKNGNTYTANVSHFSFWNCDIPVPFITLQGTLNCENLSLSSLHIIFTRPNGSSASGSTNGNGYFSGIVPANEPLIMTVYSQYCGFENSLYTTTVGPFTTDTDLGLLVMDCVSPAQSPVITGSVVDCNNMPMEGIAVVYEVSNSISQYVFTNGEGLFEITAYCFESGTVTYTLVDMDNLLEVISEEVAVVSGISEYNLGALSFCEATAIENFLIYEEGDYNFLFPFVQVVDSGLCSSISAMLDLSAPESYTMYLNFSAIYDPGSTMSCFTNYLTYILPDNTTYSAYMEGFELIVTEVTHTADSYTLFSGTYTGQAYVTITDQNTTVASYDTQVSGSFHFEQ